MSSSYVIKKCHNKSYYHRIDCTDKDIFYTIFNTIHKNTALLAENISFSPIHPVVEEKR